MVVASACYQEISSVRYGDGRNGLRMRLPRFEKRAISQGKHQDVLKIGDDQRVSIWRK